MSVELFVEGDRRIVKGVIGKPAVELTDSTKPASCLIRL